jgi:putative phage-type endonuclease
MKIRGNLLLSDINEKNEEWLKIKQFSIGSSEIAVLTGDSPFQSPYELYIAKRDSAKLEENAAMWWGKKIEHVILERFSLETGIQHKQPWVVYADPDHPYAIASPDSFLWIAETDEYGIGEVKNVSSHSAQAWRSAPPRYYWAQLQWQLGVVGLPWGFLIAKIDHDLVYYKVDFDAEWYEQALERASAFCLALREETPYTQVLPPIRPVGFSLEISDESAVTLHEDFTSHLKKYVDLNKQKAELEKQVRAIDKELQPYKDDLYAIAGANKKLVSSNQEYTVNITTVNVKPKGSYSYNKISVRGVSGDFEV